ncbi:valine--tRNA ligase [Candidatus Liberibacter sp.]|uniref:valine--tRNA ligase n=1 Tax=Candidatus Liberibacter sp. TaxID=34022 RepID=UPI0015F405E3|nr:valine--tRNA ligase [Candidatus Liberibacter sp.]MBA5724112.1 valine--tRNA ligase [Candidatus Liberibacter sp.]
MLDKTYNFSSVEKDSACKWDSVSAFRAGANSKASSKSFCIVIPPPNVTGSLHMGHAFNSVLQDIMVRFERMRGKNVLWQPGTDHAGIATQMVVERQLYAETSLTRKEIGREVFVKKVWDWKEKSGGAILSQLKRLGASCDWSRERFTMDQGMSEAVLEAFVTLYKQGLIYRDTRIVNWDPCLGTSISDLEVTQTEVDCSLWYIRYTLEDGVSYRYPIEFDNDGKPIRWEIRNYIVIATTRPETMFGDTGIAVHPDDPRYKDIIGKYIVLPIVGRRIPIISDPYPDPDFGAGAVKVTPSHDFNDFEIAKRSGLDFINILTPQATLCLLENESFLRGFVLSDEKKKIFGEFESLDCLSARSQVVSLLKEKNLLDRIEPYKHVVPYCERSGVPVEPRITEQWYLNAKVLAEPAIRSVRNSSTSFIPQSWEKNYYDWLNDIQPWCISRQLWWGHQIPVWYGPDGKVFVEKTEVSALNAAVEYYLAQGGDTALYVQRLIEEGNKSDLLVRDEDVLDTWFSSALWPFASLGWPEKTVELDAYYPTNILVTGFDILFFWVARMMMMGLHFIKDVEGRGIEPFNVVYIHALVRDKDGQKMSKSKGNVVDPIGLVDQYGADALRFYFAIMAVQGRDIKLDSARVIGYRNFITKFWNAIRFSQLNGAKHSVNFSPQDVKFVINKWVISRLSTAIKEVTTGIETRRFNDVSAILYRFIWHELCDWYVEFIKSILNDGDDDLRIETLSCFSYVSHNVCKLLHPIAPFVTEELYSHISVEGLVEEESLLCHAQWPSLTFEDPSSVQEVDMIIHLISEVRSVRKEMNVPLKAIVPLVVVDESHLVREQLLRHKSIFYRLTSVDIVFSGHSPERSIQIILDETIFFLQIGDLIDFSVEKARLKKSLEKIIAESSLIRARLDNKQFMEKAPPEIVQREKEKISQIESQKLSLEVALARVKNF